MLSRISTPLLRSHGGLLKTYNTLPAAFTTLHGTNRTEQPITAHHNGRLHIFTPMSGVTPFKTKLLNPRLFHATRPTEDKKSDWMKQLKNSEMSDWLKKTSPQALTEEAPKEMQPYLRTMRFDRPIGSWLLFLPCAWSISMAAMPGCLPSLSTLALFGVGSVLMRGVGCTINDLWDVDFDKRVARTRDRPLASGQISHKKALAFLGAQLGVSLAILLTFNTPTIILGMMSIAPVAAYPLMKRHTYWPQAFLGMTINWGVLMGYTAATGHLGLSVTLPLYASCVAWTLFYDTIYAHQDKKDDLIIGVKSTALLFGDDTKTWLAKFGGAMVGGLVLAGLTAGQTLPYYLGVAGVGGHLYWQATNVNLNNPKECSQKFVSNKYLGLILLTAIVVGNLAKGKKKEAHK